MFTAQNRAKESLTARICAGADRKKGGGTAAVVLFHDKLTNGDRVTGGARCAFETELRETEGKFVRQAQTK